LCLYCTRHLVYGSGKISARLRGLLKLEPRLLERFRLALGGEPLPEDSPQP